MEHKQKGVNNPDPLDIWRWKSNPCPGLQQEKICGAFKSVKWDSNHTFW
jgi:hypothetical protein